MKKKRRVLLAFQCSSFLLARVGSFLNSRLNTLLLDLLKEEIKWSPHTHTYEERSHFKTTKPPTSFSLSLSTSPLICAYICIWYCIYIFDCKTIHILVIDPVSDLVLLILSYSHSYNMSLFCPPSWCPLLPTTACQTFHFFSNIHSLNSMLCCAVNWRFDLSIWRLQLNPPLLFLSFILSFFLSRITVLSFSHYFVIPFFISPFSLLSYFPLTSPYFFTFPFYLSFFFPTFSFFLTFPFSITFSSILPSYSLSTTSTHTSSHSITRSFLLHDKKEFS